MERCRVLYIVSDIDKAPAFEWIAEFFSTSKNVDIAFIFLTPVDSITSQYIQKAFGQSTTIILKNKIQQLKAWTLLLRQIRRFKPHIVHCHLLTASVLGLTAAFVAAVPARIFTRHHGSMHHQGIRKGLIWDFMCNALATKIVSISPVTSKILCEWERVSPEKIVLIPHGFPLSSFRDVDVDRPVFFKQRYGIPLLSTVIGCAARFVDWKGVRYIVEAFLSVYQKRSDLHLLLMNASGPCMDDINEQLRDLPSSAWTLVPFETDMPSAYHAMDIFIHVPVDSSVEAFGQVYVESLASGVPMICTLSGIASTFIRHKHNALVVPFRDSRSIEQAILMLLCDSALRGDLIDNGFRSVDNTFSLDSMFARLERLYWMEASA